MNRSDIKGAWDLPPKEAIEYLRNKGLRLGFNYDELRHEAHHRAFTVAKVTRLDLLNDIHDSLLRAQREGESFASWKKDLKPTLQRYGWYGTTSVTDPKTQESKEIYVGSRRLKRIFDTNMRAAYNVGRYKQQRSLVHSVYWMYISLLFGENRRLKHKKMHRIVKHRDDVWWRINYPANAWGCECKVRAYSAEQLRSMGIIVTDAPLENIAHPDWAYDIGAGSRVGKLTKMDLDASLAQLPAIAKKESYKALNDEAVVKRFHDDLNLKSGELFIDATGDPLTIDDSLFSTMNYSKATKRNRHLYIDEFASLLKEPDEIYLELEMLRNPSDAYVNKSARVVKKFIRYYTDEKGRKRALIALFEYLKDKTQGVSLYYVESANTVERKRFEKLVYKRD